MPRKSKKRVCKKKKGFIQQQQEWWKKEEDEEQGEGPKWITHYCSDHQILLVGDGDFSFSLSLAKAFGSASNIVTSSLDTYDEVIKKYKNAKSNLEELHKLGAYMIHGVDATAMEFHPDLKMRRFDRIIFNFPHAGFHGKEDNLMMIKMHMNLVLGFFKNACHMLRAYGEVHVNHKTTPPFNDWNIETLAKQNFLTMIDCIDFNKEDYPGYNNKRGDSYRCDHPFPLGKCSTFKFICNPRSMKNLLRRNHIEVSRQQTVLPFNQDIQNMAQFPAPVDLNYLPRTSLFPKTNQFDCYPQTNHFPKLNEPIRSEFELRTLQSLQPWPTPTNYRYSLTEPVSNGDYQYKKAFEGSSSYMQEELYRNAQRPSYFQEEPYRNAQMPSHCFDIARYDLER